MEKLLNIANTRKWLMGEKDLMSFIDTHKAMVENKDFSKIDPKEVEKHIQSHIPVRMVDTANLPEQDKLALGLSIASSNKKTGGKVAIVEMFGTFLTRWDWWIYFYGGVAMDMAVELIDMLEKESLIDGVVLHIDSNGGSLAGTEALGKRIAKFKKPIVAFADNACHSAAYWVASQCDEILTSSETTYMGSIGVMMRHINRKVQLEQAGLELTYITAPQSTQKIKAPDNETLSEDDLSSLKNMLKQDATVFINQVKKGRGDRVDIDAVSNADIFNSRKAKSIGLHDGLATDGINSAIKRVLKLSKESSTNSNQSVEHNDVQKTLTMQYKNIKIEGKDLSIFALAKNNKLVLVSKSSMKELDDKMKGVNLEGLEKKTLDSAQTSFEAIGIEGTKASTLSVLSHSKDAFVMVDSEALAGLEAALVSADGGGTTDTEKEVEADVQTKVEETTTETVVENQDTTTEEVGEQTEVEETTKVEETTTETVVENQEAKTDTSSNISPEIQVLMDKMNQVIETNKTLKGQVKTLSEGKLAAEQEKDRIVANVNEVQKKAGLGKLVTDDNGGDDNAAVSYELGNKDSRANNATITALQIISERNVNKLASKPVFNEDNQMEI